MKEIAQIIKDENPDIICLQEMAPEALALLRANMGNLSHKYFEFNENLFPDRTILDYNQVHGRDLEVYILSKHKPHSVYQYTLSGNLGYPNDIMIIVFSNLVIVNCYLQAGSKYSSGQEHKWFHYSRCRIEELRAIKNILNTEQFKHKKIIIVGDFNFNISSSEESLSEWPENIIISEMNLLDTWKELHPGEEGLTENTDINFMRYNTKFLEKKFRYDGIFYKNTEENTSVLTPTSIELIGTTPINISEGLNYRFIEYLSDPTRKDELKGIDSETNRVNIHPSDHFGLVANFTI